MQGGSNSKFFEKKSHSAEKTKGGTFWSRLYFRKHKKILVLCENRTHDLPLLRNIVEQMNRRLLKKGSFRVRLSAEKNKPGTAQVSHILGSKIAKGLQSVKVLSSKAPQKPKSGTGLARQGNALIFFIPSIANHQKNWRGDPLVKKNLKYGGTCKICKLLSFFISWVILRVPLVAGTFSEGDGTTRRFRGYFYCGVFSLGLGGGVFCAFFASFMIFGTCRTAILNSTFRIFNRNFVSFVRRLLDVTIWQTGVNTFLDLINPFYFSMPIILTKIFPFVTFLFCIFVIER